MFAVSGWNISAPLKTQVEVVKPKDPSKKSKKRKRKAEEQVTEASLNEIWSKPEEADGAQQGRGKKIKKTGSNETVVNTGKAAEREKKRLQKEEQGADVAEAEADVPEVQTEQKNGGGKGDPLADAQALIAEISAAKEKCVESKPEKKKRKRARDNKPAQAETIPPTPSGNPATKNEPAQKVTVAASATAVSLLPEPKGLTPLQRSMRTKLASARFRHLNESLYTKPSKESLDLFKESPEMFEDYHRGFAQQVEVWPENPVDVYFSAIQERGKIRAKDPWKDKKRQKHGRSNDVELATNAAAGAIKVLPRNLNGHCTIADLGCGTASLSHRLQPLLKSLNLTIHSFDLSKPTGPSAPLVTVSDISALPLQDRSADIAIFCLALMGTNWLDFIDEAFRILRWKGELWVAEIKSRFGRVTKGKGKPPINSVGSLRKQDVKKPKGKKKGGEKEIEEGIHGSEDEAELAVAVDGADSKEGTDVSAFVEVLRKRGFVLDTSLSGDGNPNAAIDLSNKMFVKMQFVKAASPSKGKNVKEEGGYKEPGDKRGFKMGIKGKKFVAVGGDDDEGDGKDGTVLKPCLYKIR
ncbi:hypothetical protein P154DRAFT_523827 [Amniculicola lignicola CBS 123094]|uniref:Ribosomal RNA-processing protein 8 n=1 Tax=Amniculicola lignicola CBS 123094 TaxID=1392246 RepID=A0A6A5WDA5_9PLEO|nr:hypothetical protein P154DRAFT_523827 [Amniculicola lignicola CBS 123094]